MKAEELQIDLNELKEFKRKNAEERLQFLDYYVAYLKRKSQQENPLSE